MKKLLLIVFAATTFFVAKAVPPGRYYNSDGVMAALVSDNGKTIYILDKDGFVRHELEVIEEKQDGSFATKDSKTGITHLANKNGWVIRDGKVYLNVQWLRSTVIRKQ